MDLGMGMDIPQTTPWIWSCLRDATFSHFGRIPACNRGRTDRETDSRTHDGSIYIASVASRGKNGSCDPGHASFRDALSSESYSYMCEHFNDFSFSRFKDIIGGRKIYKYLSCRWRTRVTRCITANGKILKQSRDHNHLLFVGDMSSCYYNWYSLPVYKIWRV